MPVLDVLRSAHDLEARTSPCVARPGGSVPALGPWQPPSRVSRRSRTSRSLPPRAASVRQGRACSTLILAQTCLLQSAVMTRRVRVDSRRDRRIRRSWPSSNTLYPHHRGEPHSHLRARPRRRRRHQVTAARRAQPKWAGTEQNINPTTWADACSLGGFSTWCPTTASWGPARRLTSIRAVGAPRVRPASSLLTSRLRQLQSHHRSVVQPTLGLFTRQSLHCRGHERPVQPGSPNAEGNR